MTSRPLIRGIKLGLLLCLVALVGGVGVVLASGPVARPADGGPTSTFRPPPIIYRPANLSRAKPVALVIALHASGGTPALFQARTGWNAVARAHGFVVAYLGSPTPAWKNVPLNVAYISSEINQLRASQNIDPRRVYVTGFSAGAYISWFVGCRLSRQVAAIAPVSDGMVPQPCHLVRPLSQLLVLGTQDILPLSGNAIFPSVGSMAARWRGLDNCPPGSPRTSIVGPVTERTWGSCADRSAVALDIIAGGQHIYPGSPGLSSTAPDAQFDASSEIWAFFAAHRAGSTTRPSATLTAVQANGAGTSRSVIAVLRLQEGVSVQATLGRGGRTVASRKFSFSRSGTDRLSLSPASGARPGRYTARLRIRDSYGRRVTLSGTIRLS